MKKTILGFCIIILFLIILFSGCFENNKDNVELTANQIINKFISSTKNIESYKYSMNSNSRWSTYNGSEITDMIEFDSYVNASIDITNHGLIFLEDTVYSKIYGKTHRYIYLVGDFEYRGIGENDTITWKTYPLYESTTETWWYTFSHLEKVEERWIRLMENNTFERIDDETIDGKQYYVIYAQVLTNYTSELYSGYDLNEWHYKYWIDKTNNLIFKEYKQQILDETDDYVDVNDGDRELKINEYETTYYDYNIPILIEIPREALEDS